MRTGTRKCSGGGLGLLQTLVLSSMPVPLCASFTPSIASVAIDDRAAQPLDLIIGVY